MCYIWYRVRKQEKLIKHRQYRVPYKGRCFITVNDTLSGKNLKSEVTEYNGIDPLLSISSDNIDRLDITTNPATTNTNYYNMLVPTFENQYIKYRYSSM
jgi:hypothetical protein